MYISIIAFLAALFFLKSCEYERRLDRKSEDLERIASFKAERDSFWSKVDRKAQDSVVIDRREVSQEAIQKAVSSEFDKVEQFIEAQISSEVSGLTAAYDDEDTVYRKDCIPVDTVQKYFVRVPKSSTFEDEWVHLTSTVMKDSIRYDSVRMRNRIDATLGYKDRLFREDKRELKLRSYSPYSSIDYSNNIEVRRERSKVGNILLSRGAFFVYGVAGGYVLNDIK